MRSLQIAVAMKIRLNREIRFLVEDCTLYPTLMETQTLCDVDIGEASALITKQGYEMRGLSGIRQDIREYAVYWLLTTVAFQVIVAFILLNLSFNLYICSVGASLLLIGFSLICLCVYVYRNGCTDANGTRILLRDSVVISAEGTRLIFMDGSLDDTSDIADRLG